MNKIIILIICIISLIGIIGGAYLVDTSNLKNTGEIMKIVFSITGLMSMFSLMIDKIKL